MRHFGDLQAAQDEPLAFGNAAREIAEPQRLTRARKARMEGIPTPVYGLKETHHKS